MSSQVGALCKMHERYSKKHQMPKHAVRMPPLAEGGAVPFKLLNTLCTVPIHAVANQLVLRYPVRYVAVTQPRRDMVDVSHAWSSCSHRPALLQGHPRRRSGCMHAYTAAHLAD